MALAVGGVSLETGQAPNSIVGMWRRREPYRNMYGNRKAPHQKLPECCSSHSILYVKKDLMGTHSGFGVIKTDF